MIALPSRTRTGVPTQTGAGPRWSLYRLGHGTRMVLTMLIVLVFVSPLAWAAYASVSPQGDSSQQNGYGFGNYEALVHFQAGLGRYFLNSLFVALLTVALVLFISTLAGYAFARFSFPGKNVLFILILGILMVPAASLLIPLYVLLNTLGLSNSLIGLALVLAMYQLPFAVFMMRIAFEGLPMELEEAAVMDGASSPRTLWSVLIPSVTPGMITVGLFVFLASWNDFVAPLILINDPDKAPLPLAIASIRQQTLGSIDYGATEAGVVVLAIPCVVLFLVLQRFYVRGFMTGALKG